MFHPFPLKKLCPSMPWGVPSVAHAEAWALPRPKAGHRRPWENFPPNSRRITKQSRCGRNNTRWGYHGPSWAMHLSVVVEGAIKGAGDPDSLDIPYEQWGAMELLWVTNHLIDMVVEILLLISRPWRHNICAGIRFDAASHPFGSDTICLTTQWKQTGPSLEYEYQRIRFFHMLSVG